MERIERLTTPGFHALEMAELVELEGNDEDKALRLLSRYGDDVVFIAERGWSVWDGRRFSLAGGDLAARRIGHRLRQIVSEIGEWARWNYDPPPWMIEATQKEAAEKKKYLSVEQAVEVIRQQVAGRHRKYSVACGNVDSVKNTLKVCEHMRWAEVEDMDRDPWVFVLPNGALDLRAACEWERPAAAEDAEVIAARASWLRPVSRGVLPTRCGGVEYDPAADCPGWRAFLELILPDPEIRACMQRALGATLFGENRAQVCLFLRGPGGNGKSTLLNILSHVLGSRGGYAAACKIEMFLETGTVNPGAATPEEVDLPGARAYIATEPGARDVLSAKKIKGLTGGDRRMSRGLNKGAFFWSPHGIPILSCNRTPKIKDEDEGTRRRLVFFPFDVNLRALPREQQRVQGEVEAELKAEGAGILNWLLDGFRDFMAQGIAMPEPMQKLKSALMESADPVGVFLDEMTVRDPSARINVTEFYKVHVEWCETEGRALYQMKTVGDVMVEKGFERGKSNGKSVWRGIGWSGAAAQMVSDVTGRAHQAPPPPMDDEPF